jgi:hypothetical protein
MCGAGRGGAAIWGGGAAMCGAGRGGAAIWGGGGAAMCGAGRGGAAMRGGGGAAMCGAGRGGAAMCGGAGLAGGAACGGGPGFFCACEGALVVSASKTATKNDAMDPLIRTMSLLSAGYGKQREAGMKVSNPRGVTESKSRDQATLVSLRPAARFRIVSCGCAPKVGFFEYSDALPRAETAEATGPFRDQGLTPSWTSGVGCGALAVSIAPYAVGNMLAHHRHSRR